VIESNIPNTASVPRGLKAPKVRYSGHPKFETIKGTQVSRAVNTPFDILRVGDRYYLCHEAVWFESDRPEGPWIVADHVPKAIYTIPADSPAYHVIFVKVYEADEDEVVVGYTSGYQSTYVSGYTVVYGTGYYWPPYWAYYPWYDDHYYWYDPYPYYWYDPYPYSYGSASYYNPVTGSYRHGDYVYGPYGGYGTGESYNERTGRRSQSEYSWDYNSVEYSSNAYNPKPTAPDRMNHGVRAPSKRAMTGSRHAIIRTRTDANSPTRHRPAARVRAWSRTTKASVSRRVPRATCMSGVMARCTGETVTGTGRSVTVVAGMMSKPQAGRGCRTGRPVSRQRSVMPCASAVRQPRTGRVAMIPGARARWIAVPISS
jgi:hypothetical protein